MTTNKSIDGLSTRAAKAKVAKTHSVSKATTKPAQKKPTPKKESLKTKKTISPEDFAASETTNIWDTINSDDELKFKEESPTNFLKPVQTFDFNEEEGLTESEETVEEIKHAFTDEDEDENEEEEEDILEIEQSEDTKKANKKAEKKARKAEKKAHKKTSKKRRIISTVALIIVLLLIGGVLWLTFWGNDIIAKITGGRGNLLDLLTFTSETYEPLKTDANGRTNILAFGTGGYDMSGEEGGGVHDGAQLTDSIMLISFDQKTGDTAMISLPRDLKGPSTCTATGKINEVYWCNGGDGDASVEQEEKAATALMEAVGSILGVDIQYFAHLNWGSIVSIVDTLGGITVTLDEDILDYDYTGAVFHANTPYTINGAEAVGLARARHGTSGGDFSRGASQQKIIIGIKNRIFEKSLSIGDILGLVSTLGDNLRTNFSLPELKTLAHSSEILDFDVMRQVSLYPDYMTTGMLNGISYVLPKSGAGNYGAIKAYIAKQLSSDPRDYEEPTIAIYNATDTVGLASEEKAKLEEAGFTINTIDNAPEGSYPKGTIIYAITTEKPGTKRLLEDIYGYDVSSKEELPATIAPEYDFIIIIGD